MSTNPAHLRHLTRAAKQIQSATAARDSALVAARDSGATWEQVAAAAGMNRSSVIKAYLRITRTRDASPARPADC